jgi:hypothetical protein
MKEIFKGAAMKRVFVAPSRHTMRFSGSRNETGNRDDYLARKISATTLAVWKKGVAFDPKKLMLAT